MTAVRTTDLHRALMQRDSLSFEEADRWIDDFVADVLDEAASGQSAFSLDLEEWFQDEFGLEPDYLMDILDRLGVGI